jgi:hypothetical protein
MSTSDGLHSSKPVDAAFTSHPRRKNAIGVVTLTGALTLTDQYRQILRLDPGGSARDVNLPAEAISNGLAFEIVNTADAAENLVVKDDAGGTVVTISQNEKATVVCDGATWYHTGIVSIALS